MCIRDRFYVMQEVDYQFFAGSVISEMVTGCEKNPTAYERAREILRKFSLEGYLSLIHI